VDKNGDLPFAISDAFGELFKSMSEGVLLVDEEGKIIMANSVAELMFGYVTSELIGLQMETLLPERYRGGRHGLRKQFNHQPQNRKMGTGRDLLAMRKDGSEFPVEIGLSFTKKYEQLLVLAFVSDITTRKEIENELKRSEEQLLVYASELEKKVQSRTEALNKSIVDLQDVVSDLKKAEEEVRKSLDRERELNELKSKFVSIASHEFRTPLSTILSSASLVNQYKDRGDLDKITRHTHRIKSAVNHLTGILNDFLSLSKLEEGKLEVVKDKVVLEDFFNEILEDMIPTLKEGQHIKLIQDEDGSSVNMDIRIVRNILFNLISNASKYSDKPITLAYQISEKELTFSVEDEGVGIPDEDKKYMFTRFFRASTAGNVQGTGLGLNIVKRYVELLNGTITFESEYHKGSKFTVSIPL
jgi:PAS domain S-box-containing protein